MIAMQCRAARSMLGWSLDKLKDQTAKAGAPVGRMTIVRFERGDRVSADKAQAIRLALEAAGIVFIGESEVSREGGEGVRLLKATEEKT